MFDRSECVEPTCVLQAIECGGVDAKNDGVCVGEIFGPNRSELGERKRGRKEERKEERVRLGRESEVK
jgi:hypothetical protein